MKAEDLIQKIDSSIVPENLTINITEIKEVIERQLDYRDVVSVSTKNAKYNAAVLETIEFIEKLVGETNVLCAADKEDIFQHIRCAAFFFSEIDK